LKEGKRLMSGTANSKTCTRAWKNLLGHLNSDVLLCIHEPQPLLPLHSVLYLLGLFTQCSVAAASFVLVPYL
jgi:hypothetical protein